MGITHLLNITVDIERPTVTLGDYGEQVKAWAVIGNDLPARMQRLTRANMEVLFAGREVEQTDHRFYFEPPVTVAAKDRIVYDSRTFLVQATDNGNQADVYLRVDTLEYK